MNFFEGKPSTFSKLFIFQKDFEFHKPFHSLLYHIQTFDLRLYLQKVKTLGSSG